MMDARRVLIAGGGIAGMALARLLARIGVSPKVIEREPVWRPAGTGMYLPGDTARALRALGLEKQVASRAVEISRQRFYDHRGRLLCDVDVSYCARPRRSLNGSVRWAAGSMSAAAGRASGWSARVRPHVRV